jgi:hypothetical protein
MSDYDPGIDNLNVFCTILESTNRILEDATPKLDAVGQELSEAETELRGSLVALTTDLETLEKEAQAWEGHATAAVKELQAEAQRAVDNRLPALEAHVDEAKARVHGSVQAHGSSLQSWLDEVEARGFDALDAAIRQEDEEFQRWTGEADQALGELTGGLHAETDELKRDVEGAAEVMSAAKDAAIDARAAAAGALGRQLDDFEHGLGHEAETRCQAPGDQIPAWIGPWAGSVQSVAAGYHTLLASLGTDEKAAIAHEGEQATDLVEQAEGLLSAADTDFEHAVADAEACLHETAATAAVRPKIEHAEEQLTEIQAVIAAVGS